MTGSPAVALADPIDLVGPDAVTNPYPGFERLRREAPVCFIQGWGGWAVTRYKDVAAALRDARLSSDRKSGYERQTPAPLREKLAPLFRNLTTRMISMDPPAHTRIRSLLNQAFHPRLIEGIRPKVQRISDELLAPTEASGTMDVVHEYADVLPVHVMAELLGLPEESRAHLKKWSNALAAFMKGPSSLPLAEDALHAIVELEAYLCAQIAERRRQPREDLMTSMISAAERGTFLSGGVSALRKPGEADAAVALEDIEIGGVSIKKGDLVFPVVTSANRDPDQFPDPNRLDVRRSDVRHLALGLGPHYCVGASPARLEGQIALESLLRHFSRIEPAWDRLRWLDNSVGRGVESLPVKVSAA